MRTLLIALAISTFLIKSAAAQPAASGNRAIKVGVILPLTGPAAGIGADLREGLKLAEENAKGREVTLELHYEDSQSAPAAGVSAFRSLEEKFHPDLYVSSLSIVSLALAPIAEREQVPLLGIVVTSSKFPGENRWSFRYYPSAANEVQALAPGLIRKKLTNAALFFIQDDYGTSVKEGLKQISDLASVTWHDEVYLPSEKDFRPLISRARAAKPEAAILVGYDSHTMALLKQMKALGVDWELTGTSQMSLPQVRRELAGRTAIISAPLLFDPSLKEAASLSAAYRTVYNKELGHLTAAAYDVYQLLQEAAGAASENTRENLRTALESIRFHRGVLGELTINSKTHEFAFPLALAEASEEGITYIEHEK